MCSSNAHFSPPRAADILQSATAFEASHSFSKTRSAFKCCFISSKRQGPAINRGQSENRDEAQGFPFLRRSLPRCQLLTTAIQQNLYDTYDQLTLVALLINFRCLIILRSSYATASVPRRTRHGIQIMIQKDGSNGGWKRFRFLIKPH